MAGVVMQTLPSSSSPLAPKSGLDELFQEVLKVDPSTLNDGMTMDDVSLWDSLRHMELIVAIEQKFGFELNFDEISSMNSIGGIRKLVDSKLST